MLIITFKSSLLGLKYEWRWSPAVPPCSKLQNPFKCLYFKEEVLKSQIWASIALEKISLYLFPNMIFLAPEYKNSEGMTKLQRTEEKIQQSRPRNNFHALIIAPRVHVRLQTFLFCLTAPGACSSPCDFSSALTFKNPW